MRRILLFVTLAATLAGYAEVHPNYALNCEVFCSSTEFAYFPAEFAVDGIAGTRWSSGKTDDEWITLDLGEQRRIGRIIINWERSTGKRYVVQLSTDNEHFEDVFQELDGKQNTYQVIDFRPRTARYVRVDCRERTTEYGFSIWELEVYPPVANIAFRCSVRANSALSEFPAANVSDGDGKTGWRVAPGVKNPWIQLDLGSFRTVKKVELDWGEIGAKKYKVEFSEDGKQYNVVHSREDGRANEVEELTFKPQKTRYIRVSALEPLGDAGCGLDEITVN